MEKIMYYEFYFCEFLWKLWLYISHGWFYSYFLTVSFPHNGLNFFVVVVFCIACLNSKSLQLPGLAHELLFYYMCYTNSLNHVPMIRFIIERCWKCAAGTLFYNEISYLVSVAPLGKACDRNCHWIWTVATLYLLSKECWST